MDHLEISSDLYSEAEIRFLNQYIKKENPTIPYNEIVHRLNQHEPIDYILGYTYFYNLKINVNSHTLIPRPETEEMVEWIIEENKNRKNLSILDIGTGSGCIALVLAQNISGSRVTAIDIAEKALEMTIGNAEHLGVLLEAKNVNILNPIENQILGKYDVIVSNPPYIKPSEMVRMTKQVTDYEPHLALFTKEDDPFEFYRSILDFGKNHLREGGIVYMETHQDYIYSSHEHFHIGFRQDLSGNNRFIKCRIVRSGSK